MVSIKHLYELAQSFEAVEVLPHFEKISFRIRKKIFATLDEKNKRVCVKLPVIEQDVFCKMNSNVIYPVPNKWGKQGWTFVELDTVKKEALQDALSVAYLHVSEK